MKSPGSIAGNPFDNTLRAASRAIVELGIPSLDPANPLAQEQLRLVVRYLEMLRQRIAHVQATRRRALQLALGQAEAVRAHLPAGCEDLAAALDEAQAQAGALLSRRPEPGPAAFDQAARALDAVVSAIVRSAQHANEATRHAIEAGVLRAAAPHVALQRAWFAPLGLDPDAASVPDLAALLSCDPRDAPIARGAGVDHPETSP